MKYCTLSNGRRTAWLLVILSVILVLLPACAHSSNHASEVVYGTEQSMLENLQLVVDGGQPKTIRTIHYSYANNRFISLRDLACALDGTARQFNITVADGVTDITTETPYVSVGGENTPFAEDAPYKSGRLARNPITLDGREIRFYGFIGPNSSGKEDCFLNLIDIAMMLDLFFELSDGNLLLDTSMCYESELQESFYFDTHSAIVGDADTGEVFTSWEPDLSVPIASTTKLMTYIVIMDYISEQTISFDDIVTITKEAETMSRSDDGEIAMTAGTKIPLRELLYGMLIPSSNECALSLAIHAAGSEDAFVEKMYQKARELGLSDKVRFFNCHGLPAYIDSAFTTKVQNRMTANDMFLIVSYLLSTYPEITEITSQKSVHLENLGVTVGNTNPLLFNEPDVVGLKTGTTDMARNCLVALMRTEDSNGEIHNLVAIQFGAEDETVRITLSEQLIRYARQVLLSGND